MKLYGKYPGGAAGVVVRRQKQEVQERPHEEQEVQEQEVQEVQERPQEEPQRQKQPWRRQEKEQQQNQGPRRMWCCHMLILLLASVSLTSQGQTFPFREYTSFDGLPQTQSTNVMQDSRGFIWIPTRNGLARFDGNNFISYLRKDGLPSNMVTTVTEDRAGNVWAVTANGMARFNGKSFISYPLPDSLGIKQIGMGCIGRDTASFFLNASIDYHERAVIFFEDGKYYNFTSMIPAMHGHNLQPVAANPHNKTLYLIGGNREVYAYHDGSLTMVHEGPATKVSLAAGEPLFINEPDTLIHSVYPFHWEGGSLAFNFIDREGTEWIGTETSIYRLMSDAFVEYDKQNGLPDESWALAADPRGGLWIGSVYGELKYFDGEHFTERNDYQHIFGGVNAFFRGSTTLSNGEVWLSTINGVIIWDGTRFRKSELLPDSIQICIIYEDPVDKSILVGADKGLYHLQGKKMTFYQEMSWPGYGIVEGIARDKNGNYWLAGHYGVVFFDGKNFVPFRDAPAPAEMVWGLVCDYKGSIWSAGSDGLFICNPDEPAFSAALPETVNLPANVIRDLGDGKLLVGRMVDICILDLEKYYSGKPDYYKIIGQNAGFTGNDCQDNGIIRDAEGRWWILTSDKLIRFDPDRIVANDRPPLCHITSAEIPGESSEWVTLMDTALFYDTISQLKIRGSHKTIRINYTGISTRNPEEITYQYRMTGIDNSWSSKTGARRVTYNDLHQGKYTFELLSINADGVVASEPDTLLITVVPTFFQSIFARILFSLLGLVLLVLLIWRIRRRVIENRVEVARRQAESYRLQLNSIIRQFDPHFTFNAVTSVGSLIMKGEKEKAYNYFIKLSHLLRTVLTDSAVLLKPLEQELEFVTRYCELQKLRFSNRFDYSITVDPGVNLSTPVPKMIIQSFAENALKHGLENKKGKGLLEIKVNNVPGGTEVRVRDNGIGRAAASANHTHGAGTGLKNIASIIEMINKANSEKITFTLTDLYDDGTAAGTEVRVFLPSDYSFTLPADTGPTFK